MNRLLGEENTLGLPTPPRAFFGGLYSYGTRNQPEQAAEREPQIYVCKDSDLGYQAGSSFSAM
jgi:hypothetical protein